MANETIGQSGLTSTEAVMGTNVNPVTDESETFISKDTKTKCKTRNTVMIDCGSKVNVIGSETYKEQSKRWRAAGLTEELIPRDTMLKISGVAL